LSSRNPLEEQKPKIYKSMNRRGEVPKQVKGTFADKKIMKEKVTRPDEKRKRIIEQ